MPATRYGAYCSRHKSQLRRHGSPDQRGITKSDLKPYLSIVRERIARNERLAIWGLLENRWLSLVEHSGRATGTARSTWARKAGEELRRLAGAVEPRTIVETVLAVYFMQEMAGHRFRSDKAFNTQLVRRLRGLTERNAHLSTSRVTGRTKRVYSELPPRVTAVMAELVNAALGSAGLSLAKSEIRRLDRAADDKRRYHAALAELDA